ncbi:type II secretion system F family protein [Spirillospora sp. CA-253888]
MVLLVGLAALYGGIALAVVVLAGRRRISGGRIDALVRLYGAEEPPEAAAEPFADRVLAPLLRRLGRVGRRLSPAGLVARLHRSLALAGNPPRWPVERVMQVKGVGLGAGALLGLLFGSGLGGIAAAAAGVALGAAAGFLLPDLLVHNLGTRRQLEIARTLPDVLDMLTIGVEAGLGFDAAVAQVRHNAEGPLAGEFARVLQEMRIGLPRADALRAMAGRTTVAELRGFATAVVQAGELGVPIAGVLREQSREMRLRRRQRAEEAAQKVPIKILFPLLCCLFPALFIIIIGPGALRIVQLMGT